MMSIDTLVSFLCLFALILLFPSPADAERDGAGILIHWHKLHLTERQFVDGLYFFVFAICLLHLMKSVSR